MSVCLCVTRHSPANPTIENHHYPPSSYPLAAGGKRLLIPLCSNAHGIQHRLLNLVRADPNAKLGAYSQFHRDILAYTLKNTDMNKPRPRTFHA